MYVSYRWLARHVDLSGLSAEALCDDLTLSTAEVEGLLPFAPHLADVRVGFVAACERHPDADRLHVCRVELGDGDPLTIVCGAPNVARGQKVAVATPGTILPGHCKIKKSKIRGVSSAGMICSIRELDLGDEHEGIWVLPECAPVGRSLRGALDLEDWVIEIDNKSLTHRPDLWGHRGIAAEIAAIHSRPLRPLELALPETGDAPPFPVRIESAHCSRYVALAIDGARALPSPDWLRWLLLAVGQRPIDQIVDLSNFVMLDLGQPNHTFDRRRLASDGIVVRNAYPGEHMQTLDGEQRALLPDDLLVCSGDTAVALAGIMGGEESKISGETDALLLEVAHFDPAVVRRTSARLGLRTDSSARFEKSLSPTLVERAAALFSRELAHLQPEVRFPSPLTDAGDWRDPARTLSLRGERVRRELGKQIDDEEIGSILERLGFGVTPAAGGFAVAVPSLRATKDITIERDLVEEVGRIHRYGNIPEQLMQGAIAPPPRDARREMVRRIQDRLAGGARFHETLSYSFADDTTLERVGMLDMPHVRVVNPSVQGQSRVRRSLVPSLLAGLENNRRWRDDVRLFEIGKGYLPEASNEGGEPCERHLLALLWAGTPPGSRTRFDADRLSQLYGVLADLFDALQLAPPQWGPLEEPPPWAHPSRGLVARWPEAEEPAAVVAALEPGVTRSLGLTSELASDVALAEVAIDVLLQAPHRDAGYRPIPRFPGIKLDVAVALPETTAAGDVTRAIEEASRGVIAEIELFDLYRGPSVGAGRKSLAYHLLLQSEKKTLTEKDERRFLRRFEKALGALGGELRKG